MLDADIVVTPLIEKQTPPFQACRLAMRRKWNRTVP